LCYCYSDSVNGVSNFPTELTDNKLKFQRLYNVHGALTSLVYADAAKYTLRHDIGDIVTKCTVSQKTSHLWFTITLIHMHGFWYFLVEMLLIK